MATGRATGSSKTYITRLPEPLEQPEPRWAKLPTRPKTRTTPRLDLSTASCTKTPKDRSKSAHATTTPATNPGINHKAPITPKTTITPKPAITPSNSSCRFIPTRATDDYSSHLISRLDLINRDRENNDQNEDDDSMSPTKLPPDESYQQSLLAASCQGSIPRGVLSFRNTSQCTPGHREDPAVMYASGGIGNNISLSNSFAHFPKSARRKVCSDPEKILDAPNFVNDFYLNLIDWSSKGIVAVALGQAIYLWNGETGKVDQLSDVGYQGVIVTALSWAKNGKFLAVGLANGSIQLFDLEKSKKMRTMRGHTDRVISLHWNSYLLASGCKNGEIHLHDVRQQEHVIDKLLYHSLDVCGLEWSYDGTYLASGGNDNDVCIWKPSASNKPVFILQGHLAAVKALAWCPWQPSLLATGGGSKDQSIHFWDTRTGELLQSINAKSPVSSICWSTEHKELISSHGHPKCVLKIWKYPSLVKVAELKGHKERILHMSISPMKTRVISAAADETLRIWRCFKESAERTLPDPNQENDDSIASVLVNGIF